MSELSKHDIHFIQYQAEALEEVIGVMVDYEGGLNDELCGETLNHLHKLKGIEGVLQMWVKQSLKDIEGPINKADNSEGI